MKREVASLTKMMTFLTVLKLLQRFGLNPYLLQITITKQAASVKGTSAHLQEGDMLTVDQLFYGMMLPSGNDAAYALAEYFGILVNSKKKQQTAPLCQNSHFNNSPIKFFLKEMNFQAQKLKLDNTNYDSPHGLSNKCNYTSAIDQAILVSECMKIEYFRRVVGTINYETSSHGNAHRQLKTHYSWKNSNKLLGQMNGLLGCKTGVTPAAGPCLATYYENPQQGLKLAMILCHSESLNERWIETTKMVDWA